MVARTPQPPSIYELEGLTMELSEYISKSIKSQPVTAKIIKRLYEALDKAGTPIVSVWDGEQDNPVSSLAGVNRQVFNLDEAHLNIGNGWVFVVMGQDWDTIADYTINLDDAIKPVIDWVIKAGV